jgi:hypothetical protein
VFCAAVAAPVLSLFISLPSLTNSPLTPIQENPPSCTVTDAVTDICAMPLG